MKQLIKKFIPSFLLCWYHWCLAFLGACLYGFPSRKLKVIGVTGTNGKTTVVIFITKILVEMSVPGRFKIENFYRQAVDNKCQYAILEVASEGIKQHRHRFINFDTAVFTNLSLEHIEAHKGFENYRAAKAKLFQAAKNIHVINLDDKNADYFLQFPAKKKIGFTMSGQDRISILVWVV